jgi:hypothetical protein
MKKLAIFIAGAMCVASPAFAYDRDDVREQESDLRAANRMVNEDNANIDKYEDYKEQNRAERERARANREYGRQAAESATIGANDVAIGTNKAKRKLDRKLVEKNRRELNEARDRDEMDRDRMDSDRMNRYGRYGNDRELRPSSGQQTFLGFPAEQSYPRAYDSPQARMNAETYANSNYTNSTY